MPVRPIQVLSLGSSGLFVTDLYREMRTRWPGLRFDVCDFQSFGLDSSEAPAEAFESNILSHRMGLNLSTLDGLVRAMAQRQFYRRMRDAACFRRWPLARDVVALSVRNARLRADRLAPTGYALCHLHSCTANTMAYVDAIPPTTRLVCSFWGSDLLRSSGPEAITQVHRGLQRADAITTQSPELREIILSTYGRELAPRVHCCRFPANPSLFLEIESFTRSIDGRQAARRHLDLPVDARIVVVGHNGSPANRQLDTIRGIAQVTPAVRRNCHLVFPFTYAGNAAGAAAIRNVCSQFGFEHRIIEGRLDIRSLAALRVAADVFLQVPESDALSNTVLEYIFAGAQVVSGTWLPYGPFRRAGLPLVDVESHPELHNVLSDLDGAIPTGHDELTSLQARIRAHFFADAVMPAWIDVYRRALSGSDRHA